MHTAIIDANVFLRTWMTDPLLTFADYGAFEPLWSTAIMDEVREHLPEVWTHVSRRAQEMYVSSINKAYPYASVTGWERCLESLTLPDNDDRHVLAAAIVGGADFIVTMNLDDFPTEALEKHGVRPIHPDAFLLKLFDMDYDLGMNVIHEVHRGKKHPPRSLAEEIQGLREQQMPKFAQAVQEQAIMRGELTCDATVTTEVV